MSPDLVTVNSIYDGYLLPRVTRSAFLEEERRLKEITSDSKLTHVTAKLSVSRGRLSKREIFSICYFFYDVVFGRNRVEGQVVVL
jgi:uncharacterized protein (DUF58 family)